MPGVLLTLPGESQHDGEKTRSSFFQRPPNEECVNLIFLSSGSVREFCTLILVCEVEFLLKSSLE